MNRFKRFLLVGVGAALVVTAFTAPAYATYGGSNGKLAFSRGGAIVSQSPGGGAAKQLAAGLVTSPSYSPNGKKVVFLRGDALLGPGWVDVWIMNADGSGKKNLTKSVSRYSEPSFSPNRQLIMFTEYDGNPMGAERLHTIRTNGTGRRQFAPGVGGTMSDGVWSPNGSKIAYVGGPVDQAPRLRTINANGAAGSVRTAASLAGAEDPDWSPNSKRLVFVHAPATVNTRIVDRVNADKSGLKKLADYGAERGAAEPVWSPDGTRIAFDKTRYSPAGNPEIWTMRADGTGKTKVDGNGYGPTWQSR